jgi:hypothetical protein
MRSLAYAPDAVLIVPLWGTVKGAEAIRRHDERIRSAFPDARLIVSRPVVRGDHTALEWEFRGTHAGPIAIPGAVLTATRRAITLRGASFLRFTREGLIAEEHRYYDVCSLLDQMGSS